MDTVGGAQAHVRDIANGQKKSKHTIYLMAGGGKNDHKSFEEGKIHQIFSSHLIRNLNVLSDIKAVFEIRKVVKKIRPDILAIHSSKAGIIGRVVGWSLGIPTVFTVHGWSFTEGIPIKKKRAYILIEKAIGLISDGVITVSEYDKRLALQYRVLPEKKIVTIHNGVHDIVDKRVEQIDERPKIIMVARFSPPKKQLQFLKALSCLTDLRWEMYFVGEGELLKEAQKFVVDEGLSDRVYFWGNRNDVAELLYKSHLFVLLSDWEGLPLSILEAMSCGLPIVASDVGGVKEAVIQSINGFVIPRDDDADLINKLTLLLTDSSMRIKMGKESRILYEKNFTFDLMHEKTLAYYKQVIQKKRYKIPTKETNV